MTYIISALMKAQTTFQSLSRSLLLQALVINICALIVITRYIGNFSTYVDIGYQSYCIHYLKVEYVRVKTLPQRHIL